MHPSVLHAIGAGLLPMEEVWFVARSNDDQGPNRPDGTSNWPM